MTNNLRFIGVNTLKNISDAIREKVGRKDPIAPGKWEETLMPFDYESHHEKFSKNFYYQKSIAPGFSRFNGQTNFMFISGNEVFGFYVYTTMYNMFNGCVNLYGQPKCPRLITNLSSTYRYCHNLTGSPVCAELVTDMATTYSECYNLTGSPVCGPNVTRFLGTYEYCYNLTGSPVCGHNVDTMEYTYQKCNNLNGRPVCGDNVIYMGYAYQNCSRLTGSPIIGSKVAGAQYSYANCPNLGNTCYIDATSSCAFDNTFAGSKSSDGEYFRLIIGANVNVNNINASTFGETGWNFETNSYGEPTSIHIETAHPNNGVNYTKFIRAREVYEHGNIHIFEEINVSQGGGL